jgi:hypothetical protein
MSRLGILAASAFFSMAMAAGASAGSSQCTVADGDTPGNCTSAPFDVSPRDTQLAGDYYSKFIFTDRALGCTALPCTEEGGRELPCTYHYTFQFKQCSMCCTKDAQLNR